MDSPPVILRTVHTEGHTRGVQHCICGKTDHSLDGKHTDPHRRPKWVPDWTLHLLHLLPPRSLLSVELSTLKKNNWNKTRLSFFPPKILFIHSAEHKGEHLRLIYYLWLNRLPERQPSPMTSILFSSCLCARTAGGLLKEERVNSLSWNSNQSSWLHYLFMMHSRKKKFFSKNKRGRTELSLCSLWVTDTFHQFTFCELWGWADGRLFSE